MLDLLKPNATPTDKQERTKVQGVSSSRENVVHDTNNGDNPGIFE
jgi:hypothetical protein